MVTPQLRNLGAPHLADHQPVQSHCSAWRTRSRSAIPRQDGRTTPLLRSTDTLAGYVRSCGYTGGEGLHLGRFMRA